ncbi:MAG: SMP-30/gluconolactonase/LRE family protein [Ectothiorhodospiraceae bacterium]|nr:SMP-30/gluconolactonase/LRE family protein [Ectothiorhodospiraceae bacterium]
MVKHAMRELLRGGSFYEGPRWRDGHWWVSDFYRHTVYSLSPDGKAETFLEVPGQPSGIGWLPDHSMLIVSMKDQRVLRRHPDGRVTTHADLSRYAGGYVNDMVVDARGRAWVGNFGFDLMAGDDPRPAVLVRVEADGAVAVVAEDLYFPNGTVITPDGRTLIVGETFAARMTAFDIGDDGSLSGRRVWAQLAPTPPLSSRAEAVKALAVAPDGCCLDADGCIWVADAVGGRCLRVAEGGDILDEIPAPDGLGVFACMLGGEDGRTLLLCCAPDSAAKRRAANREAVLFTCRVDVAGAGLP